MVSFCGKNILFRLTGLFLLLGLLALTLTGCLFGVPPDDPLPWNAPNERDGMIPLPNSMLNRYN